MVMVESMLRTSFCAVPAFSRVDPATSSGADDDLDAVVRGARPAAEPALQESPTVSAPAAPRVLDRADGVGRAAGGGDADDAVLGGQPELGQVRGGQLLAVLGTLDGGDHRRRARPR